MTNLPIDRLAELRAPAHWQAVDFISDLHLHPGEPQTLAAWQRYLERPLSERADALFILGDLFEVWVGDDALENPDSFGSLCARQLHQHSIDTPVFFMCGNRDFLVGPSALRACGMQGLDDPTVLEFMDERWLLSHGVALCLDDTDYLAFRAMVRSAEWQSSFLAQPLAQREAVARDLFGPAGFHRLPAPIMGAEDFAYVLEKMPGAMLFLGVAPADADWGSCCGIHSTRMIVDESVMPRGTAYLAALAERFLVEGFG